MKKTTVENGELQLKNNYYPDNYIDILPTEEYISKIKVDDIELEISVKFGNLVTGGNVLKKTYAAFSPTDPRTITTQALKNRPSVNKNTLTKAWEEAPKKALKMIKEIAKQKKYIKCAGREFVDGTVFEVLEKPFIEPIVVISPTHKLENYIKNPSPPEPIVVVSPTHKLENYM